MTPTCLAVLMHHLYVLANRRNFSVKPIQSWEHDSLKWSTKRSL